MDTLKSFGQGAKKQWKSMLGDEPETQQDEGLLGSLQETKQECCNYIKLSYKQRLYGFAICFTAGVGMGILVCWDLYLNLFLFCLGVAVSMSCLSVDA